MRRSPPVITALVLALLTTAPALAQAEGGTPPAAAAAASVAATPTEPATHAEPAVADATAAKEAEAKLLEMLEAKDDDGKQLFDRAAMTSYLEGMPKHVRDLLVAQVSEAWISGPEHLHALLTVGMPHQLLDVALRDKCVLCHTDPTSQEKRTLFTARADGSGKFDFREFTADAHFRQGLSCSGCHGGRPEDDDHADDMVARWPKRSERRKDRAWIAEFCGRCHADTAFMRRFDPNLPTDQLAKYRESRHGQLLLGEGDSKAAQCVSCHGVHGIRPPESRLSSVHPQRLPETCGKCHADAEHMAGRVDDAGQPLPTDQLEKFRKSVHGRALLQEGDLAAPSCNDCHGGHASLPPDAASAAQACRTCHAAQATLFDGSPHAKAFAERSWPECGKCHGSHAIAKPSDDLVGETEGKLCHDCHVKESADQPECDRTARHFRVQLAALVGHGQSLSATVHGLRERGLDTEGIVATLADLDEAVFQTRTNIHSFDRRTFDQTALAGHALAAKAESLAAAAEAEYAFRVKGLAVSIGVIGLLCLALWLRVRAWERANEASPSPDGAAACPPERGG